MSRKKAQPFKIRNVLPSFTQNTWVHVVIYESVYIEGAMHSLCQRKVLDTKVRAVREKGIPELQRFVIGILKDKDTVMAGLTQVYSNGPVEAQVHKLKQVKRSMFGRAKLALLRQRLLNAL